MTQRELLQSMATNDTSKMYMIFGMVSLAFGGFILFLIKGNGIPDHQDLEQAEGSLRYIEIMRSSRGGSDTLRFGLNGIEKDFQYPSKAGALEHVHATLNDAGNQTVTVLYDNNHTRSPLFDDQVYHTVFALSLSNQNVRSYIEIRDEWTFDNKTGVWMGWTFISFGALLLINAFFSALSRQRNRVR